MKKLPKLFELWKGKWYCWPISLNDIGHNCLYIVQRTNQCFTRYLSSDILKQLSRKQRHKLMSSIWSYNIVQNQSWIEILSQNWGEAYIGIFFIKFCKKSVRINFSTRKVAKYQDWHPSQWVVSWRTFVLWCQSDQSDQWHVSSETCLIQPLSLFVLGFMAHLIVQCSWVFV